MDYSRSYCLPDDLQTLLLKTGIRPSPVRILTARCLDEAVAPLSIQDIETRLQTVDRSSISRTLALFASRHLVHIIEDGSGVSKYELCRAPECHSTAAEYREPHSDYGDLHPHFYCEKCRRTFCIDSIPIPPCPLPEGFSSYSANYVIKGICRDCSVTMK